MGAPTIGQHTQPGKGKENPVGLGGGNVMGAMGDGRWEEGDGGVMRERRGRRVEARGEVKMPPNGM